MKTYRVSWKALSMLLICTIISMLYVVYSFINGDWIFKVISIIAAIGFSIWFYYYYRLRRIGAAIIIDDEGVTINFKGDKIYWHEIEKVKLYKSSILDNRPRTTTTMIYPKVEFYKDIRIRLNKPYASNGYGIDWPLIENAKDFNESVFAKWEAYKQGETTKKD